MQMSEILCGEPHLTRVHLGELGMRKKESGVADEPVLNCSSSVFVCHLLVTYWEPFFL